MKPARLLLTPAERKIKKAERRAKQRAANASRALKMHAARLAHEQEASQLLIAPLCDISEAPPRLNIGCSGWFYWDWRDTFYPPGLPTKEWFQYYASQFDTVELNAPFYSWPTLATVRSWLRQAQRRRFFYTVKVCELITHVKRFVRTATLVRDFCFIKQLIEPHMGCFLFQLPPSFHFSAPRLKRILDQLDPANRNIVEFRHPSWWTRPVFREFQKHNAIFCSCSAPRLPEELVQTHDEIYIRFHGTKRWYRHDYSPEELAAWAKRIRQCNPTRAWIYFNNDYGGNAIRNAHELARQLDDLNG